MIPQMSNTSFIEQIELIGGPQCGDTTEIGEDVDRFPIFYERNIIDSKTKKIKLETFTSVYEKIGNGKAQYIEG